MITELDLREAIAECEGARNPSASTCIKLAAFYTILDHLYGSKQEDFLKSFDTGYAKESNGIKYSESEFSEIVRDKGINACFGTIDELMATLYVMNPSLYRNVIQKLTDL